MKKFISLVFAVLTVFSANSAFAASATDLNKTITRLGAQSGFAYFVVSPALTIAGGCSGGDIVYIADLSTAAGKSYYATLLTAYSQGKPISRVDYGNSAPGGLCLITLLEVS